MARLFYGWVVVAGAFVVLFVAYGAQYSFGVFFSALLDEFGWSRASLAGAFAMYAFTYSVLGFPAGRLTDSWGPRRVIAIGGCFASSGSSVGTIVLPPLAQELVAATGWRTAYVVLGVVVFITLTVVALAMRRDPESLGLHPDGAAPPPRREPEHDAAWPLRRAGGTAAFWMLAAAFSATWLPVFIPLVHLVRFSQDLGYPVAVGASVISSLGVGAVAGRLGMGAVSDRLGRRGTVLVAMALQSAAFAGLSTVQSLGPLYATAFLFGYSYGAISALFPAIVGDFFGRAQAGTLVGVLFAVAGSMAGWGPWIAGAIYDATGSYAVSFRLSALLNGLAIVPLLLCRPPRLAYPALSPPRESATLSPR